MKQTLIVTIDTEEEGLWSGTFTGAGNTVENVKGIPPFQSVCDNYGVKPTYLVNSPVVSNAAAAKVIETIAATANCEIGCHIHPWNTPPVVENISAAESYLCNLPLAEQEERLSTVTAQIADRFGTAPTSFRAGRYGLDADGARLIAALGYIVDSSVCPFMDYSEDGGPDFGQAPWRPYFVGDDLLLPSATTDGILEVPVSFGFNWFNFDRAYRLHELLADIRIRRLRLRGIFEGLGILQKIKFCPEKHDFSGLKRLADAYAQQQAPCIVMMFHSSSLVPGMSPYVASRKELQEFLSNIEKIIAYCLEKLDMEAATLSDFAQSYSAHERALLNV